ncbi:MAG: hypothetical protein ACOC0A_03305, partial [Planctomycetota bacterium]
MSELPESDGEVSREYESEETGSDDARSEERGQLPAEWRNKILQGMGLINAGIAAVVGMTTTHYASSSKAGIAAGILT